MILTSGPVNLTMGDKEDRDMGMKKRLVSLLQ